jgi:hypothetical protein
MDACALVTNRTMKKKRRLKSSMPNKNTSRAEVLWNGMNCKQRDAWLAEYVMGEKLAEELTVGYGWKVAGMLMSEPPKYTSNLLDALRLAEKLFVVWVISSRSDAVDEAVGTGTAELRGPVGSNTCIRTYAEARGTRPECMAAAVALAVFRCATVETVQVYGGRRNGTCSSMK